MSKPTVNRDDDQPTASMKTDDASSRYYNHIRGYFPGAHSTHHRNNKKHKWLKIIAALIVILLILAGMIIILWLHSTSHNSQSQQSNNKVGTITADVSRHYLLPTNEEPALITITDKSKLQSPFFKRSENGDKVLVYQRNSVAIIYRPGIDRIIAVGPVTIDTPKNGAQ